MRVLVPSRMCARCDRLREGVVRLNELTRVIVCLSSLCVGSGSRVCPVRG